MRRKAGLAVPLHLHFDVNNLIRTLAANKAQKKRKKRRRRKGRKKKVRSERIHPGELSSCTLPARRLVRR